jgi:glycosyltransferase involved in cell wall biosynthesis
MSAARDPYVAFLVKRFPRLSETFVLNEFLELRAQGVPLRLFAVMDPAERHTQPEAEALRGEVTYLRTASWLPLLPRAARSAGRHLRGSLSALGWVLRQRRVAAWRRYGEALILVDELEGEPVHLHVHWAHAPAEVAFLAHIIAGIPWSLTTHAKDLYTVPVSDIAERCAQAIFVATCTAANARYLIDVIGVPPDKVTLCRHGVRLDRFDSARRHPQPGRILSIGRLVPKKGFSVLIQACAFLRQRGVDFHLDVVGDGLIADELKGLVVECGLTEWVTFHGGRPQPELVPFYEQATVFALAPAVQADGDRDGIPNVILEAMASGTPVVAAATSGIPEVVFDNETGLLVPPGDPEALANALERLLSDPAEAERLGKGGEVAVRAAFEIATCVTPMTDLLGTRLDAVRAARS